MRRPSLGRAPEPRQRVIGAPDLPQRESELRLHRRVLEGARCALEWGNRLGGTVLLQQGAAEQVRRLAVLRNARQHVAGEALGLVGPTMIEGADRPLELRVCAASGQARFV